VNAARQRLYLFLVAVLLGCGCARARVERVEWQTMGTIAAVQWKGACDDDELPKKIVLSVKESFADIERLLNAHDADSELSRLASLPDAEILRQCSALVRPCYEQAFLLRDRSKRVFDPRWKGEGAMDLGGIAKGFAVDLAAERIAGLLSGSAPEVLIDLGGNLKAVRGSWMTAVEAPAAEASETFSLKEGAACATSGEYYRGTHIRDGRTGEAPQNAVFSVTVRHPHSALLSDGLSTVLFILGRKEGETFLRRHYPEAEAIWMEK